MTASCLFLFYTRFHLVDLFILNILFFFFPFTTIFVISIQKLVDMLEENTHLPAVLQSLGCIAQNAIPVFETRESEIKEFITNKILKSDGVSI